VNQDGERHGQGVMRCMDRRRYEGEQRTGNLQGHGTMTWPDGRVESGQWDNYTCTYPDGRVRSGVDHATLGWKSKRTFVG
jgi:hypothetical protein